MMHRAQIALVCWFPMDDVSTANLHRLLAGDHMARAAVHFAGSLQHVCHSISQRRDSDLMLLRKGAEACHAECCLTV